MRKALLTALAAGGMAFVATGALAQDEKLYLSTDAGKHVVVGDSAPHAVAVGTGGKPADCPPGTFYMTEPSQQMVRACDDDTEYGLTAAEAGAVGPDGQPLPEGTMVMTPAN